MQASLAQSKSKSKQKRNALVDFVDDVDVVDGVDGFPDTFRRRLGLPFHPFASFLWFRFHLAAGAIDAEKSCRTTAQLLSYDYVTLVVCLRNSCRTTTCT